MLLPLTRLRAGATALAGIPSRGAAALVSLVSHGAHGAHGTRAGERTGRVVLHASGFVQHARVLVTAVKAGDGENGQPRAGVNPKRLTTLIKQVRSIQQLLEIHAREGHAFNAIHLSAFWHTLGGLARRECSWLRQQGDACADELCELTLRLLPTLEARELATVAHGMAKAGVPEHDQWSDLWAQTAREVVGRVREFNPQGLANTAWAFATAGHAAPQVFEAVAHEAAGRMREFNPQSLTNTAWAFATAGHAAPELFEAVAHEAVGRVREFKPQGLSNTAWAFATAGHAAPELFEAVAREAAGRVLRDFMAQTLANTVWAFATAGHAAPELFEAVAREAAGRVREFQPQNLASTAWAFSTSGHAAPELFEAVAREVAGKVPELEPQALAITVWAFAKCGHAAPPLFEAVAHEAAGRVREFNMQALADTAWAFATAGHAAPELFEAVADEAAGRLHELTPQGLANTAWAFASAGQTAPALFHALAPEAVGRVREFSPQGLASTAWAFATAGHAAPELYEALARMAASRTSGFSPQDLANTAWAFASVGHTSAAIFDAVAHETAGRVRELSPQSLANMAWAFAVADADEDAADRLFGTASGFTEHCDSLASSFNVQGLNQLHQWQLWHTERRARWPALSLALQEQCADAFVSQPRRTSRLQQEVCSTLSQLVHCVREEVSTPEGYQLDITGEVKGIAFGVEVDGPFHFLGSSQQPTGATLLKRRQLRHFGCRLLVVPYWEWNDISSDRDDMQRSARQREYLTARLDAVLAG